MFFQQNLRLPNEEIQKQQKENTLEKDHPFLEHKKKKSSTSILEVHGFGTFKGSSWSETWGELGELVEVSGMDSLHTHADALYSGKLTWEGGKSWKLHVFRTTKISGAWTQHIRTVAMVEKGMLNKDFTKIMNVLWVFEKCFFLFLVGVKTSSYLLDSFYIASLLHWFRALRPLSRWTRRRWEWNYSYVYIYIYKCMYIWKTKNMAWT